MSGLPFPTSGDLSNSGIKPRSLVSPALPGRFFITIPPGFIFYTVYPGHPTRDLLSPNQVVPGKRFCNFEMLNKLTFQIFSDLSLSLSLSLLHIDHKFIESKKTQIFIKVNCFPFHNFLNFIQ